MPRKVHPIDLDQKFRIQAILARRLDAGGKRLTMASMARELGESQVSVAMAIYNIRPGTPRTREMQIKIAAYLELPVAALFWDNGNGKIPHSPPLLKGGKLAAVLARARSVFKKAAAGNEG